MKTMPNEIHACQDAAGKTLICPDGKCKDSTTYKKADPDAAWITSVDPLTKAAIHILLDMLPCAARGESLDPELCIEVESIAKQYGYNDWTHEDVQALYDCTPTPKPKEMTADQIELMICQWGLMPDPKPRIGDHLRTECPDGFIIIKDKKNG